MAENAFGKEFRRLRRAADVTQVELDQKLNRGPGFTSSIENGRYKPKSTTWLKEALETLGCDRELSRMLSLLAKDQQRIVFEVEQMTDLERQVVLSLQFQIAGGIDQKRLEQIAKVVGKGVAMT